MKPQKHARCRQCDSLIQHARRPVLLYEDSHGRDVWLCGRARCDNAYSEGEAQGSTKAAAQPRKEA